MAHDSISQVDQVGQAEESAAAGDHDGALRILDRVLAQPDHVEFGAAVRIAAAIHGHRGMLHRSAELYRHVTPESIGDDAAAAVLTLIGVGDTEAARPMRVVAEHGSPTSVASSMRSMARGLEQTLSGDGRDAYSTLVQGVSSMAPIGQDVVIQDTPASLAALVAINVGELDLALSVLLRAIEVDLGGQMFRDRHQVLLAWTMMLHGDLASASQMADAVLDQGGSNLRNELFAHAVRVGVARRSSDISTLAEAWGTARGILPGHSVDLYSLLPLGELSVAAARLRDDHRVKSQLDAATALLDKLGHPPLWSATFHWYGVQAAILVEHPTDLIPHADALVAAAQISRHAGLLARAGQTWLRILQEDVDTEAVRQSVQDLDGIGLSWDASRLAAQAAARTTDRQAMLELLHAARSVQQSGSVGSDRSGNQLTDREWEIGRLVVDGIGYREIGERLFISPKTVEHHVASIRRRLGSTSRKDMLATLKTLVEASGSS